MTKLINKNKLDSFTNKLYKRITKSFVSKTLHNNVSGETIFSNGYVEGSILRLFSNKNPNMLIGNGGSCFGVPSTSINAGVNVGKIAMAVDPSLEVGSTVRNVVALAVKKSNNTVKEIIVENETATVYYNNNTNLNAQKIIYININRSFSEEVYFLIGCDRMLWAADTYPRAHAFGGLVPAVGTSLQIADYHYSGRFIIFSSRTSFDQLVGICNDSVSKTKNNILTGKTILQDAYIQNGDIYSVDNPNATDDTYSVNSDTVYSGTANKVIPANKNVTSIVVAVSSSMNVGTVTTGINVGVVSYDTNEIIEYVHQNSTGIVYENTYSQINASRIVNIPINKSWDQSVYFIIGVNGMLWNSPHRSLNLDRVTGGNNLLSVGHRISNLNRTNYIGRIVVLGEVVSLNTLNNKIDISQVGNEANKIPRVGDNGKLPSNILPAEVNGGVRTVNGISPVGGNVNVSANNITINSNTSETIDQELNKKVNKNTNNDFTAKNNFINYSPTVSRIFTRAFIKQNINNANIVGYDNNRYCAYLSEKYNENNKQISHILLPIKNGNIGQSVIVDVFAFNSNNRVTHNISARTFQIVDIDIAGCKCAKIPVNISSGTEGIGFGFMIASNNNNHKVACVRSTSGSNNAYDSITRPNVNTSINTNARIEIPYKICYETTSELVTRFELEKVTNIYPRLIGEYRSLSYDAGDILEENGHTWIKANGQSISKEDYPDLYEKFNSTRTIDEDIEITIPLIENQIGYYYICAKIS